MPKQSTATLRIPLMLGIALALSLSAGRLWQTSHGRVTDQAFSCSDPVTGCVLNDGGARLRFSVPARAAQPFDVRIEGVSAKQVSIGLEMVGMEMGVQPQPLLRQADGSWLVHAWLPVCTLGRRDWDGVISVDGRRYRFRFVAGGRG
jgi:hypothetical protein